MARDDNGDGVLAQSVTDGTLSFGMTDPRGAVGVALTVAERNLVRGLENFALKRCTPADIHRELEVPSFAFEVLAELTALCAQRAGGDLEMGSDPETHPADIPFYVTDNAVVTEATGWKPRRTVPVILDDIFAWLASSGKEVQRVLSG